MPKETPKRSIRRTRSAERRYSVRGVRRDPMDIDKLSRAIAGLAMAEMEKQAQNQHEHTQERPINDRPAPPISKEVTSDG